MSQIRVVVVAVIDVAVGTVVCGHSEFKMSIIFAHLKNFSSPIAANCAQPIFCKFGTALLTSLVRDCDNGTSTYLFAFYV